MAVTMTLAPSGERVVIDADFYPPQANEAASLHGTRICEKQVEVQKP